MDVSRMTTDQLTRMGKAAMMQGRFRDALYFIDVSLDRIPGMNHPLVCPLLMDRAECHWVMNDVPQSLNDMQTVIRLGAPQTLDQHFAQIESRKWLDRAMVLLYENAMVAEHCFDVSLSFSFSCPDRMKAECLIHKGVARFLQGNSQGAKADIKAGSRFDRNVAEGVGMSLKGEGIKAYTKANNFNRSKQFLQVSLQILPGSTNAENKRSAWSHLANVHFRLNEYHEALGAGQESFNAKPVKSREESQRWRERGKRLFGEKKFVLLIECYTLAIKFAPVGSQFADLLAPLYSSRSLAYIKLGNYKEALTDARVCVKINPQWSKAHYRLGSSLAGLERHREALNPFCLAFDLFDRTGQTENAEKKETLMQILSVADKLPGATESVELDVPKSILEDLIKKFVAEKSWDKLRMLFLGGGGPNHYEMGRGGLATGCDASSVPLELVVQSIISGLPRLVEELIKHGAPPSGSPECDTTPLTIALNANNDELVEVLAKYDKEGVMKSEEWKDEGVAAFRAKDYTTAIRQLTRALRCTLKSKESKNEASSLLTQAYFRVGNHDKCLEIGRKLYVRKSTKSEAEADKWKKLGNELLKDEKYEHMCKYYSLALDYTPQSSLEQRAAILSNRSMAYVKQGLFKQAKEDATECLQARPSWFRGFSRLAAAWNAEGNKNEALNVLCTGLDDVGKDDEKLNIANDIISTAMQIQEGVSKISIQIPVAIMNKIIKEAAEKCDWDRIRFIFLERESHQTGHRRYLARGCDASCVPLDLVFLSDVKDKQRLILELLVHGASPNGARGCPKQPLLLALESKHYKIAVELLRHHADSSCVVGKSVSMGPFEGQGHQWLHIAKKNQDPHKAEMMYNLALEFPDVENDEFAKYAAYHQMSEVSFLLGDYKKCLESGNECFRMKAIKSEEDANNWVKRGQHLTNTNEQTGLVPSYLTMALKYVPTSSKTLFAHLLCLRSKAYHNFGDIQQALEDANTATNTRPDSVEAYDCQVTCYTSLGRSSEAMLALNQCIKLETDPENKSRYLNDAISLAVKLPEGTTSLTSEVPRSVIIGLFEKAVKEEDWATVGVLLVGGGGPSKHRVGNGGLGTGLINAEYVPIEDLVSSPIKEKSAVVDTLLKHGAKADGLRGKASPLVFAAKKKLHEVVEVLVQHGSNPCVETNQGLTLLHDTVKEAIDSDEYKMLEILLKSIHPNKENLQDIQGNSLYHLAVFGNINKKKCKVIKLLSAANVNPTLKNKQGKQPKDILTNKRDGRSKLLWDAEKNYNPRIQITSVTNIQQPKKVHDQPFGADGYDLDSVDSLNTEKLQENSVTTGNLPQELQQHCLTNETPRSKRSIPSVKEEKKEERRREVDHLIKMLVVEQPITFNESESKDKLEDVRDENEEVESEIESEITTNETTTFQEEAIRDGNDNENDADENDEDLDNEFLFENLPWEVDCTDHVWKILRSKRVKESTKKKIIEKIRMLAEGRWSTTLCKRLDGLSKRKDILLFEAKLSKGARILWEKTIAFSARCSNDPNLRVKESEGRVYSDIIRVWDVVLDHDTLSRQIENIVKSHNRGRECIVKTNLKGFAAKGAANSLSKESLPSYYLERSEVKTHEKDVMDLKKAVLKKNTEDGVNANIFYPPASARENEYHILKFYSITSAFISTLLENDQTTKIDFPFKVTELEHTIINLNPKPARPIILLGRSGTGKTTCCLYRLWSEFQIYWERAVTAGPHMPKYAPSDSPATSEIEAQEKMYPAISEHEYQEDEACASCEEPGNTETSSEEEDGFDSYPDKEPQLDEEEGDGPRDLEHLHQVFITKNTVLCSEVQKNFRELSSACPATKDNTNTGNAPIPPRFEDVAETDWPLFIGARDWLLMLDASLPGEHFFKRAADGSLLRRIEGWGDEDTHLHFIPDDDDEDEDDDDERQNIDDGEDQGRAIEDIDALGKRPSEAQGKKGHVNLDPKREINYQVFRHEIWPKMVKYQKVDYHPTLVWTEIRSFIKGSTEALLNEGVLSCDSYMELGRKRAPNFTGDRNEIYGLFKIYERVRSSNRMFDEADLVYHLHRRLMENPEIDWSIHRFYVDETQDFSQAELSLLIRCCRYPNDLFFTGDTAQSIMRGIAFRFEDLKTLFYLASKASKDTRHEIRVPDRLYQLTHNYRSHAGILRLASSVVNLLLSYFPESFDKLEKDSGMFDGPRPVLLESCSLADLAMILRGNKRHTSRIEFGAHQAILVASEEAREQLPDELKHGLVLTVYEAKGLEFDDVLIYNFFKDSQAKKEWRVVASYIEELEMQSKAGVMGLVEIGERDLKLKTRPLEFDADKHKVLNSEFKYLYTAITRARVNVWFFDEDEVARAPMFEYFQRFKLVRVVKFEGQADETSTLTTMFAESSTKAEWRHQGMYFYNKHLWTVAEKCFVFAEDDLMVKRSRAQRQAAEAFKARANQRVMKEEFFKAAKQFLECSMPQEAAICLNNAKERLLLAKLYRKTEKFTEAAKLFKREGYIKEASDCYENLNNYNQAIELLCQSRMYRTAITVLERYNSLKIDEALTKQGIVPPKSNRTVERLYFLLAEEHLNSGKREDMEAVLRRLLSPDERITFLKKHGCIEEAARALVDSNRREEAASFLQLHGQFLEAVKYSDKPKFLGDCYLYEARASLNNLRDGMSREGILKLLENARSQYCRCGNKDGEGKVLLTRGRLMRSFEDIKDSGALFNDSCNHFGECEVIEQMFELQEDDSIPQFYWRIAVRTIERLFKLLVNLNKKAVQLQVAEQKVIDICEEFFGLHKTDDARYRRYLVHTCERFASLAPDLAKAKVGNVEVSIDTREARKIIGDHIFSKAFKLMKETKKLFQREFEKFLICKTFVVGLPCKNVQCRNLHTSDTRERFDSRYEVLFNAIYVDATVDRFLDAILYLDVSLHKRGHSLVIKDDFETCSQLYDFLFSALGPGVFQASYNQVEKVRRHHAVRSRLIKFCDHLWKQQMTSVDRRTDSNEFLKVSCVLQILDLSNKTANWLSQEEQAFKKSRNSHKNSYRRQNGMLPLQKNQQGSDVQSVSFLRLWEDAKSLIHTRREVLDSVHTTIRGFLGFSAKGNFAMFPSIANTLMILEQQLTICLAMFASLCSSERLTVCLPASYLARVSFWDNINCTKKQRFTLFKAADNYRDNGIYRKKVQSLLEYIVNLTFGMISQEFNVFHDTFSSQGSRELVLSGEAERTLVLSMTMLSNCGRIIPPSCNKVIFENIVAVTQETYFPERLVTAFQEIRKAARIWDVVSVLKNLLAARNEKLFDLRWHQPYGKTHHILWYDTPESNPSNYRSVFDVDVLKPKTDIKTKGGDSTMDAASFVLHNEDRLAEPDEEEEEEEEETEEQQNPEEDAEVKREEVEHGAARLIQKVLLQVLRERKKLKRKVERQQSTLVADRLGGFKIDTSACTICDVGFDISTDPSEEINKQESINPHEGEQGETSNTQSTLYHRHLVSESHRIKSQEFEEYRILNEEKIDPIFTQAKVLAEQKTNDLALDQQQIEQRKEKVWSIMNKIESSRMWIYASDLQVPLKELEKKVEEVQATIKQDTSEPAVSSTEKADPEADRDAYDEEDIDDPKPLHAPKGSKHKKKRKKKRSLQVMSN